MLRGLAWDPPVALYFHKTGAFHFSFIVDLRLRGRAVRQVALARAPDGSVMRVRGDVDDRTAERRVA